MDEVGGFEEEGLYYNIRHEITCTHMVLADAGSYNA
jgi:hypothetical protein